MKKIKTKIFAGVLFLFIVILILSVLGIFFINRIARSSKGAIKDNYRSIQYTTMMTKCLDTMYKIKLEEGISSSKFSSKAEFDTASFIASNIEFKSNLSKEAHNITEIGEEELVNELKRNYNRFLHTIGIMEPGVSAHSKSNINEISSLYDITRENILEIYRVNMNAILLRSSRAENTAGQVTIYMAIVAAFSILSTLFFIFKFPSKIVSPISELTAKINEISNRNYEQKLDIISNDEMGELARAFNVMVQRLKEYEYTNLDQLLFEKKRMDAIVKNLQDGVMILDENKNVILANNSMISLTGLKEEDVLNRYAPDIAARNDLVRTMISNLMAEERGEQSEEIKPIKIILNGKENYYSIEHINLELKSSGSNKNKLAGYIIMLKNVTLYQERDTAKTNLIATVSHELKTPLSSINLSLKLLDDDRIGEINEEQKGLINSIRQQSTRLSKVVNELLDFSQAETGNIKLKITEIRPEDIVELAVVALMMFISEKNIRLETSVDESIYPINADLEKTVWVLVNIINNAIRYSPEGGKITVKAENENGFVKFLVKDEGTGISEEDCQKVFDKFVQVGNGNSKGSGLGLAISKEFVVAQGGKIWVESKLGEGSEFFFTLPISSKKNGR